jgi:hypothetical protein
VSSVESPAQAQGTGSSVGSRVEPPEGASSEAARAEPAAGPGYEERFLTILNNGSKYEKDQSGVARVRGFVVIGRGAESLQPLQSLCFDSTRTINNCLTARYRVSGGRVFGTLFRAFASDVLALKSLSSSPPVPPSLGGELRPDVNQPDGSLPWSKLTDSDTLSKALAQIAGVPVEGDGPSPPGSPSDRVETGEIDATLIERLLGILSTEVLQRQDRLVLFCEFGGEPGALADWQAAVPLILERLPERMGIVFGGAPEGFNAPSDRHFLELQLPPLPPTADGNAYRYTPSAMTGDQPADQDRLGLAADADALAQLVLLPETRPFTMGIVAQWGRGKSSFMKLIQRALVHLVTERVDPQLMSAIQAETESIQRIEQELLRPPSNPSSGADFGEQEDSLQSWENTLLRGRDDHTVRRNRLVARADREATRQIVMVDFNAWRYQDSQQIWAGLAKEATASVERALPRRARLWAPISYMIKNHRSELAVGVLIPSLVAGMLAGLIVALGAGNATARLASELPALGLLLQVVLPAGSVVFTVWFIAWRIYAVLQPVSQRVAVYARLPEYKEQLGFQEQVLGDLAFLRERLAKRRRRWELVPAARGLGRWKLTRSVREPRIVVFIDDLDRCSEDKIREVLQTVNLVLNARDFFVFLAMDTDKIYPAIEHAYSKAVVRADDQIAVRYLEKILQLSYKLPAIDANHRATLIGDFFSLRTKRERLRVTAGSPDGDSPMGSTAAGSGVLSFDLSTLVRPRSLHLLTVQDTGVELKAFEDMKDFIHDNPREIKRLLNVHRLVKILLQRPETALDDPQQRKLVAWLVFCARWPKRVEPLLEFAARAPADAEVLLAWATSESVEEAEIRAFVTAAGAPAILAQDLKPGRLLAEAARVSQMIRGEPLQTNASARVAGSTVGT